MLVTPAVQPPVAPMLARLVRELPREEGMIYEPKWDGFRCIVFRDGDYLEFASRNERPLTRYFPELVDPLRNALPESAVLDGEIVVATDSGLDFDALSERIHPAESRIRLLATTTPASFIAFDLLALESQDLTGRPFSERRKKLEQVLEAAIPPVYLTPATTDPLVGEDWFVRFEGAGLDGVVAKPGNLHYEQDRRVMYKMKHQRTADCVVGGFRWYRGGAGVGSLLLGLYDAEHTLQHVGVASGFSSTMRSELVEMLSPYRVDAVDHPWLAAQPMASRLPGGPSRWSRGKDSSFEPLRPELVSEVAYDHLQGDRFRHATTFVRWRPDRSPQSCTYDQLDTPVPLELRHIFELGNDRRKPSSSPAHDRTGLR